MPIGTSHPTSHQKTAQLSIYCCTAHRPERMRATIPAAERGMCGAAGSTVPTSVRGHPVAVDVAVHKRHGRRPHGRHRSSVNSISSRQRNALEVQHRQLGCNEERDAPVPTHHGLLLALPRDLQGRRVGHLQGLAKADGSLPSHDELEPLATSKVRSKSGSFSGRRDGTRF